MSFSLDTETTGTDFWHGASPFFCTICHDNGDQTWWSWDVDPLTREVFIPREDVAAIRQLIDRAKAWGKNSDEVRDRHKIVGQNLKFDRHALYHAGVYTDPWPWDMTEDTLIAGHLLASNRPHNLTDMAMQYLGVDIEPHEKALHAAVNEARRWARSHQPEWRIAKVGLPEMPSAKGECWKFDMWLPRAIALDRGEAEPFEGCEHVWREDWVCQTCGGHRWHVILRDYSNADSGVTILLWQAMAAELTKRDLWAIYRESMRIPEVIWEMERRGVTVSKERLRKMRAEFAEESERCGKRCVNVAKSCGYDLELPKSGNNKSLLEFCFGAPGTADLPQGGRDRMMVEADRLSDEGKEDEADAMRKAATGSFLPVVARTDKGAPSLDKNAIAVYQTSLPEGSKQAAFIKSLSSKRQRDTSVSYMEGYEKFWLEEECKCVPSCSSRIDWKCEATGWRRLHPSINQTGTDTLRMSHSNPNSANISKQKDLSLREAFGPGPVREWWSCDAQNIELRIPAFESGEEELINVFLRPKEPPYFGSYHLVVFDALHPKLFAKHGKECKNLYESTWYQWVKNGNFCVPMDTEALTSTGWKRYDDLKVGDLVLGYNGGELEWTPVLEKMKFSDAPLTKISKGHFSATTTPNHRWFGHKRVNSRTKGRRNVERFFTTEQLNSEHTIYLSAPCKDGSKVPITEDEAAIIGFVYGDGSIEVGDYVDAPSQSFGRKVKFRVRVFQSKEAGIEYVDGLFKKWGKLVKRSVRPPVGENKAIVVWELDSDDARELWDRAGLKRVRHGADLEGLVLRMGHEQRAAYLTAVFNAEGWTDPRTGTRLYAQNCGSFADSIRLAVFLSGKFPTIHYSKDYYGSDKQMSTIRESKPYVTGQRIKKEDAGRGDVWCVRTDVGTWVMRQGDAIMLTGNSVIYGAQEETADRTYRVKGAFKMLRKRFPKLFALSDRQIALAERRGYVETMPDRSVDASKGYPLLCARTEWGRISPTVPLNYHVSGTAMQWTRRAKVRCHELLEKWNRETKPDTYFITLQVHDELVFDFPKWGDPVAEDKRTKESGKAVFRTSNLWRIRAIQKLMEQGGQDIGVPTPVGVTFHPRSWATGVDL